MRNLLLLVGALLLFVVPFGGGINTQAQETPSISEFNSCVSFFTRKLSVREKECRWYEFEVSVEGGGPSEPAVECPAFTEFQHTQGIMLTGVPIDQFCLNDFGVVIEIVPIGGSTRYSQVGFLETFAIAIHLPSLIGTDPVVSSEITTLEEADECVRIMRDFVEENSIPDCFAK